MELLGGEELDTALVKRGKKLRTFVEKQFGVSLNPTLEEMDEDAPVVVEDVNI